MIVTYHDIPSGYAEEILGPFIGSGPLRRETCPELYTRLVNSVHLIV